MDDSMKEAVRALARYVVTGTLVDPSSVKGLNGFRLVGDYENLLELRNLLGEAGADEKKQDRVCEVLLATEDKASAHEKDIIGRADEQLRLDGSAPFTPEERQYLAVFVMAAWNKAARPDEEFKTEVVEVPTTAPKAIINLDTVPVVTPNGTKKAKKATSASATAMSSTATAASTSGSATPVPSTVPESRVTELEKEVADLKRHMAGKDALIAELRKDMARQIDKVGSLINYCEGVGDRPAFLNRQGPPPAEAHPARAEPDAPAHAPSPDPAEIRKWENHFPLLMADLHLVDGHRGKDREAKLKALREKQATFRRRGGAAYQRAVQAIDAFIRGEFTKDPAAFMTKFQGLS
jgi:hypothetical protein